MGERYFEIDAVRGAAVILMVLYHTLFCLYLFKVINWFDPQTFSGAPGAAVFIAIAGLSLVLARRDPLGLMKRGLYILVFAAVVSLVTWIFYPQGFVAFGVLHLIGVSTILSYPFLKGKWYVPLFAAAVIFVLTPLVSGLSGSAWLLPFGVTYPGFASVDYEPLLPWFGVLLVGVCLGKLLYPEGKRGRVLSGLSEVTVPRIIDWLCFVGRHTLFVYMIHVPIILGVVWILFG